MAFEMIDGDEGKVVGEGESLGVGDADEKRAGEAGTGGDGDGVEIGEGEVGFSERGADDGNDGAEMLAAGQLRNDAAVARVGGDLRGDDGGKSARAALDDGRGGFVAGGFDAEDEAGAGHDSQFSRLGLRAAVGGVGGLKRVSTAYDGRSENRNKPMAGSAQFEAALRIVEKLRARGTRRISRAGACAICCWAANRRTTTWRRTRRPMWCWRCFRGPLPWARILAWCWWPPRWGRVADRKKSRRINGMRPTEVATFRSDLAYSDGRHPDAVRYTKTAEEDVQRRDFTINGLLLDPCVLDRATAGPSARRFPVRSG